MVKKKNIVLLGATGSIGQSTLAVLRKYKDYFNLSGIAGNNNVEGLSAIAKEFNVPHVAIFNEESYFKAKAASVFTKETELHYGIEGLTQLATLQEADLILVAITGTTALHPTLEAIKLGKTIALASKEILVMAGSIVMTAAKEHQATILPIDSEHNAIFQCLHNESIESVDSIILTASGGPFRNYSLEQMKEVSLKEALKHPTWAMGKKITIDCATMANKGLELIEAHWLFSVPADKLKVLVHPQSIIHSLVQFIDGSIIAQLAPQSMTFPIQYALFYPERKAPTSKPLDLSKALNLELSPPDLERFPCLKIAIDCLKEGNLAPAIFNAANEVAVQAFIDQRISFLKIPVIIDKTLELVSNQSLNNELNSIIETHNQAIATAAQVINEL